jgi:uncharacterized protein YegL
LYNKVIKALLGGRKMEKKTKTTVTDKEGKKMENNNEKKTTATKPEGKENKMENNNVKKTTVKKPEGKENKMEKKLTELVFILDRSGSMSGLESDTIGGFNSMLEKQRVVEGDCLITTALFDSQYELLHDRIDIKGVSPLTDKEYYTRGSTALLDAIGSTIEKISTAHSNTLPEYRPANTLCVIITDGMENSSRKYNHSQIKEMVETRRKEYNWEFVFLGANIDSFATAESFGIVRQCTANYRADSDGVKMNFMAMSDSMACMRKTGKKAAMYEACERINENFEDENNNDPKK